jgi:hypothetical protein
MTTSTPLISRRLLGAAAASALALGFGLPPAAFAATPKDTLVVAWAFDDIITMDPAEAFEISAGEVMGNTYDRLLRFDVNDPSKLFPTLPNPGPCRPMTRPTVSNSSPAEICLRQPAHRRRRGVLAAARRDAGQRPRPSS